jgi:hypothetical protein
MTFIEKERAVVAVSKAASQWKRRKVRAVETSKRVLYMFWKSQEARLPQ